MRAPIEALATLSTPVVFLDRCPKRREILPYARYAVAGSRPLIRLLRGRKMCTISEFFHEIGAALQFGDAPENYPAYSDHLDEMPWDHPCDYAVFCISDPFEIFHEARTDTHSLLEFFLRGARFYASVDDRGECGIRDPVPLKVVLEAGDQDVSDFRRFFRLPNEVRIGELPGGQ